MASERFRKAALVTVFRLCQLGSMAFGQHMQPRSTFLKGTEEIASVLCRDGVVGGCNAPVGEAEFMSFNVSFVSFCQVR